MNVRQIPDTFHRLDDLTWNYPAGNCLIFAGKMGFHALGLIEIINNTRGGIEGKIWERGDWGGGGIQVPDVHSFTMSKAKRSF